MTAFARRLMALFRTRRLDSELDDEVRPTSSWPNAMLLLPVCLPKKHDARRGATSAASSGSAKSTAIAAASGG